MFSSQSEDLRLWFFRDEPSMYLLEDGSSSLEECGFRDEDAILAEVRNTSEGTWPEEISSVFANAGPGGNGGLDRRLSTMRSTTQGAGMHYFTGSFIPESCNKKSLGTCS